MYFPRNSSINASFEGISVSSYGLNFKFLLKDSTAVCPERLNLQSHLWGSTKVFPERLKSKFLT